jgi:hypothetical protein
MFEEATKDTEKEKSKRLQKPSQTVVLETKSSILLTNYFMQDVELHKQKATDKLICYWKEIVKNIINK